MRFLDAKYFIGVAILGLALSLSLEAQAQSIGEAAASKIFYNTMGGQTVLVGVSSDLGQSPEAIVINDRKLLKKQEVWALQPLIPPDGLVRVEDGPPGWPQHQRTIRQLNRLHGVHIGRSSDRSGALPDRIWREDW